MAGLLILARSATPALCARLDALVDAGLDAYIVVDDGDLAAHPRAVTVDTDTLLALGIVRLTQATTAREVTAWERGIAYAALCTDWERVWLMEDDVHITSAPAFAAVLQEQPPSVDLVGQAIAPSPAHDRVWPHWLHRTALPFEPEALCSCFLVVCRLSRRLLDALVAFAGARGQLSFLELLIPTLARAHGMSHAPFTSPQRVLLRYQPPLTDAEMQAATGVVAFHPVKHLPAQSSPPPPRG
jgi:hypothetical protein